MAATAAIEEGVFSVEHLREIHSSHDDDGAHPG